MQYPAHMKNVDGEIVIQTVYDHLEKTALYAAENLFDIGLRNTGYICGVVHDLGKYTNKYKEYLEKSYNGEKVVKGSVNHTFAGVIFILERYHKTSNTYRRLCAELIAYVVGAHHGLFDIVDIDAMNGFAYRLDKERDEILYDEAVKEFLKYYPLQEVDILFDYAASEVEICIKSIFKKASKPKEKKYYVGMLARLILSALIDGDRKDTAEFMSNEKIAENAVSQDFWKENLDFLQNKLKNFKYNTQINKVRQEISDLCYTKANLPSGIYRVNVPTGGGKTLSTLRYALAHNQHHDKKRAIFIIPLLSVLEQNSMVISDFIKDKSEILEHHSNVVHDNKSSNGELENYELFTQTWEKPIVISTMIQLLNILFSHKTSDIRRMKSLISSTIIIDEIQSIPNKMITMFNLAMNFTAHICNTTVVLSSATQPDFESTKYPIQFSPKPELLEYNQDLLKPFKRTRIEDRRTKYGLSMDEFEEFIEAISQNTVSLLVICNKKKTAFDLFRRVERLRNSGWKVFHLSTSMCQAHRADILYEINNSLKKEKTICIATQLVEAGIDFSFESVIRVLAGLDNIAQAAGRCNRHGEYKGLCSVYIVNLKDEKLKHLIEIQTVQQHTSGILESFEANKERFHNDLLSQEAIKAYYASLYADQTVVLEMDYLVKGKHYTIFDLISDNQSLVDSSKTRGIYIMGQAFKEGNGLFRVFDDDKVDVVVPYKEGKDIIADLYSERSNYDRSFLRKTIDRAKPYTISLFSYTKEKLLEERMLKLANQFVYTLNPLCYEANSVGLLLDYDFYIGEEFL